MTTLVVTSRFAKKASEVLTGLSQNVQFKAGDYPSPSLVEVHDEGELEIVEGLLAEEGVLFNRRQA